MSSKRECAILNESRIREKARLSLGVTQRWCHKCPAVRGRDRAEVETGWEPNVCTKVHFCPYRIGLGSLVLRRSAPQLSAWITLDPFRVLASKVDNNLLTFFFI